MGSPFLLNFSASCDIIISCLFTCNYVKIYQFLAGFAMQQDNFFELGQRLMQEHAGDVNEMVTILTEVAGGRVELIVSSGQTSPEGFMYDQDEDEWVMVLQGNAILEVEDELYELGVGDSLMLTRRTKHRIAFTSSNPACLWLAVYWR